MQSDTGQISFTDQRPTIPELIEFPGKKECINIAEEIGVDWRMVGSSLLDDKYGKIMPAIAEKYRNNASDINMDVLSQWIQGKGIADCTWHALLRVLKRHCRALAERVEEALTMEREEEAARVKQSLKDEETLTREKVLMVKETLRTEEPADIEEGKQCVAK